MDTAKALHFNSNGAVRVRVCTSSNLTVKAEGTSAGGLGSRLNVTLDRQTLFDGIVNGSATIRVEAPHAGWIVIALTNDVYQAHDDRNLVLRSLVISGRNSRQTTDLIGRSAHGP